MAFIAVSSVVAVVYWFAFDFREVGLVAYLPFLLPPIAAAIYWFGRERRFAAQVQLWETIMEPFPSRVFPAERLDPTRQGFGWMEVRGGVKIGVVISLPSEDGIHLQMGSGRWRFNDKLLPWEEIAKLSYLGTGTHRSFGAGSVGYVAVQFITPRNLKMVVPWRETFHSLVPERLGFQEVRPVSGAIN